MASRASDLFLHGIAADLLGAALFLIFRISYGCLARRTGWCSRRWRFGGQSASNFSPLEPAELELAVGERRGRLG